MRVSPPLRTGLRASQARPAPAGLRPEHRTRGCLCLLPRGVLLVCVDRRSAPFRTFLQIHFAHARILVPSAENARRQSQNGFCCVSALSAAELSELNRVCDEWVTTRGREIDVPGQGQLFFPLLHYPEVDFTVVHPNTKPLVGKILGGWEKARLIEFNYRGWCVPSKINDSPGILTRFRSTAPRPPPLKPPELTLLLTPQSLLPSRAGSRRLMRGWMGPTPRGIRGWDGMGSRRRAGRELCRTADPTARRT